MIQPVRMGTFRLSLTDKEKKKVRCLGRVKIYNRRRFEDPNVIRSKRVLTLYSYLNEDHEKEEDKEDKS